MCFQNTRLNRHRRDVTIPKGRNRKQGRGNGLQKVKNLVRQVPQDFKAGENSSLVRCAAIQTHWGGNITPKAWWGSFYPLEIVPLSLFIFPSLFIPSLCPHFGVLLCVVNFTDLFFSPLSDLLLAPSGGFYTLYFLCLEIPLSYPQAFYFSYYYVQFSFTFLIMLNTYMMGI